VAIIPLGLRLLDRLDAAYPRVDSANRFRFSEENPLNRERLAGFSRGRASPTLLFGLAPRGVFHASNVAIGAVGSYPTVSPLPVRC
jgi:hypothetical protein